MKLYSKKKEIEEKKVLAVCKNKMISLFIATSRWLLQPFSAILKFVQTNICEHIKSLAFMKPSGDEI